MVRHMSKRDWLVLVPVAGILALVLALTATARRSESCTR